MREYFPIIGGIIVFFLVIVVGNSLLGPVVCNDGWRSGSIGRQGACSWHGGVNKTASSMIFFAAAGAGAYAYTSLEDRKKKP